MKNAIRATAFAGILAGLTSAAGAATVDFSKYYGGTGKDDWVAVDQSYGDVAGVVDVSYEVISALGYGAPSLGTPDVYSWDIPGAGYRHGSETDSGALVASGSNASVMLQITVTALGSNLLTSFGAAIAYWLNDGQSFVPLAGNFRVFDENGNPVLSSDNGPGSTLNGFTASAGIGQKSYTLQVGPDYNLGVQSFNYELAAPSTVPVPPAFLLLGSAFAGLFGLRFAGRKPALQA